MNHKAREALWVLALANLWAGACRVFLPTNKINRVWLSQVCPPFPFSPCTRTNVQDGDFLYIYYIGNSYLILFCQSVPICCSSPCPLRELFYPASFCLSWQEQLCQQKSGPMSLEKMMTFWTDCFSFICIVHKLPSLSGTSGQPTAKGHP